MRLRNKKTGAIGELRDIDLVDGAIIQVETGHGECCGMIYHTLADLNEEWEDYEEPHKPYRLTTFGEVVEFSEGCLSNKYKRKCVDIGNYFDTREEAEKAVEKLKAWKRLKDKGFRFNKWTIPEEPKTPHIKLVIEAEIDVPDSPYDLDLLFGGEE